MLGGKSVWLIVVLLIIVEGCYCLNSTQKANETLGTTFPNEQTSVEETTTRETEIQTVSQNPVLNEKISVNNSTNLNQTDLEVVKIFHYNSTNTTEQVILVSTSTVDSLNVTSLNETLLNDKNYTMTGAAASSEDVLLPFRLPNWAAIVAGVCLVSAVIGYISCVSYRRFLQRKYGNVQMVIGEDVYDTSDLRNFEI